MNDIFEFLSHHSRATVKIVIAVITVISLLFKVIVPKIKERADRIKTVATANQDNGCLYEGINLFNAGQREQGVQLMIKGLESGVYDLPAANNACSMLIQYYDELGEQYSSMRWGRFAVENNCCDKSILEYMIYQYEHMGEISKAQELKELLKNS